MVWCRAACVQRPACKRRMERCGDTRITCCCCAPRAPCVPHATTAHRAAVCVAVFSQLGQQDVEEFIKNLVENGQPVAKVAGLGKSSLSAMGGAGAIKGAPEGVEANNFDGQRGFSGTDPSMFQ